MALSFVRYTADGNQNVFPLTFPYIDVGHIVVKVDDSFWNFTVDKQYNRVTLNPTPAANRVVSIRRNTPRQNPYSNFSGGNAFGQVNVNNNFLWQLYISQEIAEGGLSEEFQPDHDIDMGGKRIINLGAPVNPDDAARYRDLLDFPFQGEKGDKGDKGDQGNTGPQGQQGVQGIEGPQGVIGRTPDHEWDGKFLRLVQGDGTWGNWSDLEGPQGVEGPQGPHGPRPSHRWINTSLQMQQGDGTWGNITNLIGPAGPIGVTGPQGPVGPTPRHEWAGPLLRFIQGDGTWGNYQDLTGPEGPQGQVGIQGATGVQGPVGPIGIQGEEGPIGPRGDKGDKGDDGDSFHIDEVGLYADLANFADRPKLFTYLATDYEFSVDSSVLSDNVKSVDGQLAYPIRFTNLNIAGVIVQVGGATQDPDSYSIAGGVLTFKSALPRPDMNINVRRILLEGATVGALFMKNSDTAGDWTTPIPFGRGPEGPKGPQGDRGERGPQGLVGPQGEQGPEGERGPTGTQGPTGSQGARGPEGPKGVQGDKGIDGSQGATGLQGERGPEGPMGVQGDKGVDGQQGPQGLRGPEGQKGVQGDKGIDGQQGPQGVAGPIGPQGPEGARGDNGFQGPSGPQGPVGPMGAQGDKGPNGQAGERGSRAFYEAVSAVTWNQGLVDRFFGPTAAYPYAVAYDLFVQYNESKGYSETRVFRNNAWQVKPVNLVQDFINKVSNGVTSTSLEKGKVSKLTNSIVTFPNMGGFGNSLNSALFTLPDMRVGRMSGSLRFTLKGSESLSDPFCQMVVGLRSQSGSLISQVFVPLGTIKTRSVNEQIYIPFTLVFDDAIAAYGNICYLSFDRISRSNAATFTFQNEEYSRPITVENLIV
ncbi:MAG: phage tail fiber protein [Aeromonas popoffii]|uniref:phage tail fiber domain-containing protein n=1 Tax=Aeromonas popoffii TaxID=70856 RepID=UPI003F314442